MIRLRESLYLPSRIVKEQPIGCFRKEPPINIASLALLIADSSLRFPSAAPQGAGGANRDRTGDLLLAKQALSQLSYGPV